MNYVEHQANKFEASRSWPAETANVYRAILHKRQSSGFERVARTAKI